MGTSKKGACVKMCAVYAEETESHRMQGESAARAQGDRRG